MDKDKTMKKRRLPFASDFAECVEAQTKKNELYKRMHVVVKRLAEAHEKDRISREPDDVALNVQRVLAGKSIEEPGILPHKQVLKTLPREIVILEAAIKQQEVVITESLRIASPKADKLIAGDAARMRRRWASAWKQIGVVAQEMADMRDGITGQLLTFMQPIVEDGGIGLPSEPSSRLSQILLYCEREGLFED